MRYKPTSSEASLEGNAFWVEVASGLPVIEEVAAWKRGDDPLPEWKPSRRSECRTDRLSVRDSHVPQCDIAATNEQNVHSKPTDLPRDHFQVLGRMCRFSESSLPVEITRL